MAFRIGDRETVVEARGLAGAGVVVEIGEHADAAAACAEFAVIAGSACGEVALNEETGDRGALDGLEAGGRGGLFHAEVHLAKSDVDGGVLIEDVAAPLKDGLVNFAVGEVVIEIGGPIGTDLGLRTEINAAHDEAGGIGDVVVVEAEILRLDATADGDGLCVLAGGRGELRHRGRVVAGKIGANFFGLLVVEHAFPDESVKEGAAVLGNRYGGGERHAAEQREPFD